MKHFYISLFTFIAIIAGSFRSNSICKKALTIISSDAAIFCEVENIVPENIQDISKLKKSFYSKKNMLQLFINKEHIEEIEINILLLENAVKSNDADACRENSIEIVSMLSFLDDNLTASD